MKRLRDEMINGNGYGNGYGDGYGYGDGNGNGSGYGDGNGGSHEVPIGLYRDETNETA